MAVGSCGHEVGTPSRPRRKRMAHQEAVLECRKQVASYSSSAPCSGELDPMLMTIDKLQSLLRGGQVFPLLFNSRVDRTDSHAGLTTTSAHSFPYPVTIIIHQSEASVPNLARGSPTTFSSGFTQAGFKSRARRAHSELFFFWRGAVAFKRARWGTEGPNRRTQR